MDHTYNHIRDAGECSIEELTKTVFSEEPKPPKSFLIAFSENCMREVFEALLTFLVDGMKSLYAKENGQVYIAELAPDQLNKLKKYMNSIGFNLFITEYTQNEWETNIFPYFVQFNNMPYDFSVSDLTIYQYAISCEDLGKHYIVSFATI